MDLCFIRRCQIHLGRIDHFQSARLGRQSRRPLGTEVDRLASLGNLAVCSRRIGMVAEARDDGLRGLGSVIRIGRSVRVSRGGDDFGRDRDMFGCSWRFRVQQSRSRSSSRSLRIDRSASLIAGRFICIGGCKGFSLVFVMSWRLPSCGVGSTVLNKSHPPSYPQTRAQTHHHRLSGRVVVSRSSICRFEVLCLCHSFHSHHSS